MSGKIGGKLTERRFPDWLALCALLVLVTLVFCAHYNRWSREAWRTPINYIGDRAWDMAFTGDALWGMAATKAMADGEIMPVLPKYPQSLGAPFRANWNDFPSIEEGINAWWALLAKIHGLFFGSNLVLLWAHLLAAISFYCVCRYLGYQQVFSFVGAALFALSRYAFWRNLPNLSLTYYWHLPLGLLVVWWCLCERPITRDRRKIFFCGAVPILFAVQSPYFSGLFAQFLFWAALVAVLRWRDWRRAILPAGIFAVLAATIFFMNIDTVYSVMKDGPNPGAAPRWYFDVERYALRPVEFFLPRSHSLKAFEEWANTAYFKQTGMPGEMGSVYLGIIAAAALAILCAITFKAIARGELKQAPLHFWGICAVLLFSITGGLGGIGGVFGFLLFRASNRYSIVILLLVLLFLVKWLSARTRNWSLTSAGALAFLLLVIGVYDQVPPRFPEREVNARKSLVRERKLMAQIEEALPEGASVFQLPVYDFPEGPLIGTMTDYEHFRPYLHSSSLKFSYGATKGRYRERWQHEAEQLGTEGLVRLLEQYGFAAVLINREGYSDRAASLVESLHRAGKQEVIARAGDWICLALNPSRHPALPPVFGEGWHALEGSYRGNKRWSTGDATLTLVNPDATPRPARVSFGLSATRPRQIEITSGGQTVYEAKLETADDERTVDLELLLQPGNNDLQFTTDNPAEQPTESDSRVRAFNVTDFRVVE